MTQVCAFFADRLQMQDQILQSLIKEKDQFYLIKYQPTLTASQPGYLLVWFHAKEDFGGG